jgi:hypothetical protein
MTVAPLLVGAGEVVTEFGALVLLVVSISIGIWLVGFIIREIRKAIDADGGILPGGFSYLREYDPSEAEIDADLARLRRAGVRNDEYRMPSQAEMDRAEADSYKWQDELDHFDRQKPVIDRKRDGTAAYYHRARRREVARRGPINF